MTSPSIADLFKIDGRYFKTNFETILAFFQTNNLTAVPTVVNDSVSIGIEVEMEKVHFSIPGGLWNYLWNIRTDGSLRNGGLEAVSVPVKGEWIRHALTTLYSVIKEVHFSNRTSIHIHLDVRQLTRKQLTAIVLVYLSVESLLYKFVGKDRHENIYCVPLYTTGLVNSMVELINTAILKHNFGNNRYAGLNLDAIRKFGTLEFRQMHGTHDVVKIINWINLLFKVYEYAMAHDLDFIIKKISELNTNSFYIAYLNEVFDNIVHLLDVSDMKSDLEKGVKAVKQSIISNKFAAELRRGFDRDSPAAKKYCQLHSGDLIRHFFSPEGLF